MQPTRGCSPTGARRGTGSGSWGLVGSPLATHVVDTTDTFEVGLRSLECHQVYLRNLGGEMASPADFLRSHAAAAGKQTGVEYAATFEVIG